jgi:hypothetical protein
VCGITPMKLELQKRNKKQKIKQCIGQESNQ